MELCQRNERGIALLMTVFIIALATLLVLELGQAARYDVRASRAFSEGVQGDFVLKSGVNFARILLELPKQPGVNEDWLGEPWYLISSAPSLPIAGIAGDPRLLIVDESGKIDLNWLTSRASAAGAQAGGQQSQQQGGMVSNADFWKSHVGELFNRLGFQREQYDPALFRTPGNIAFDALNEVAVIDDFIDSDSKSFNSASFPGEGAESDMDKRFFYNRPLLNLSEVLLVPGMTRERLARISPFVRVSPNAGTGSQKINVNTAPLEVLLAMGFPETQAIEVVQTRTSFSINESVLKTLIAGDPQLAKYVGTTSSEFSVYVRATLPNSTRWLRAVLKAEGGGQSRQTKLKALEVY